MTEETNVRGRTNLRYNVAERYKSIIQSLQEKGEKFVNKTDKQGRTHIHTVVVWCSMLEVKDTFFLKRKTEYLPSRTLIETEKIIELLLSYGANINDKDVNGRTPLHYVASFGAPPELLMKLLNNGADINAADNEGCTPLHLAIKSEKFDIVKNLLERNPSVNVQNKKGETPLHFAVSDSNKLSHCGDLLLHKGALASTLDNNGHTPLDVIRRQIRKRSDIEWFLKCLIWVINLRIHPQMEIDTRHESLEKLKGSCLKECQDMNIYFKEHGKSQLQVILQNYRLPWYTANDFFHSKINSDAFKKRFSNYSFVVRNKFLLDQSRMETIKNCISVFSYFGAVPHSSSDGQVMCSSNTHWEDLPEELKLKILSYLSTEKLEYLEKYLIP